MPAIELCLMRGRSIFFPAKAWLLTTVKLIGLISRGGTEIDIFFYFDAQWEVPSTQRSCIGILMMVLLIFSHFTAKETEA